MEDPIIIPLINKVIQMLERSFASVEAMGSVSKSYQELGIEENPDDVAIGLLRKAHATKERVLNNSDLDKDDALVFTLCADVAMELTTDIELSLMDPGFNPHFGDMEIPYTETSLEAVYLTIDTLVTFIDSQHG